LHGVWGGGRVGKPRLPFGWDLWNTAWKMRKIQQGNAHEWGERCVCVSHPRPQLGAFPFRQRGKTSYFSTPFQKLLPLPGKKKKKIKGRCWTWVMVKPRPCARGAKEGGEGAGETSAGAEQGCRHLSPEILASGVPLHKE